MAVLVADHEKPDHDELQASNDDIGNENFHREYTILLYGNILNNLVMVITMYMCRSDPKDMQRDSLRISQGILYIFPVN
jgi:hypothetical protein